jgi:hypothetical protein
MFEILKSILILPSSRIMFRVAISKLLINGHYHHHHHHKKSSLILNKFPQTRQITLTSSRLFVEKQNEQQVVATSTLNDKSNVVIDDNSKRFVLTGNKNIDVKLDRLLQKLFQLMSIYEEMIGLKELKMAQQSVIEVIDI